MAAAGMACTGSAAIRVVPVTGLYASRYSWVGPAPRTPDAAGSAWYRPDCREAATIQVLAVLVAATTLKVVYGAGGCTAARTFPDMVARMVMPAACSPVAGTLASA